MVPEQPPAPRALRVFSEGGGPSGEVDLAAVEPSDFFKNDVVRCRITGTIPSGPDYRVVIPGLVSTDANGYKSGAYGAFTRLSSMP